VVVASPDYFSRHSVPTAPQDLVDHDCINMRQATFGGLYGWEFARDGRDVRVRVEGQLTFNSSIPMIEAATNGFGIAYVPENLVSPHIAEGSLRLVLDDWSPPFAGYHLYYPSGRQLSPAMAVTIEALRHRV
jgi:DNA-binding transcriptional LysR family regulator